MRRTGRPITLARVRGLTLVEIMVALGIGAFMLIGIITLVVSVSQTRVELSRSSENIENGRYAVQLLSDDIVRAGFYGRFSMRGINFADPQPDPCATNIANMGFAVPSTMPTPVFGYASGATLPACLANAAANTPALVVRRVATVPIAVADLGTGNTHPFLQVSGCDGGPVAFRFALNSAAFDLELRDCNTPAPVWSYSSRVYYLSPCSDCDGDGDGIPTLRRAELTNNTITVLPQVEGVEDIHFRYGLDTNSNGAPNCYVDDPQVVPPAGSDCPGWGADAAERWSNVVAVRVNVLVRSIDNSPGWTDTRTYDLGRDQRVGPFDDGFRRRVFSSVVVIPNMSGVR